MCFSQPLNQSKSPIVHKAFIKANDLVESIRNISQQSINVNDMKGEMKGDSFKMSGFVIDDTFITEEFNNFKFQPIWESFFRKLLGTDRMTNEYVRRKCASIYLDLYYLITNGDLTPKHVSLAQYIHQFSRSKLIITLLNKLGHCISYPCLNKNRQSSSQKHHNKESNRKCTFPYKYTS